MIPALNRAYLLIGSNLGNKQAYLQQACALIEKHVGNIVLASAYYETAAWGFTEQPSFYNQALAVDTVLQPSNLMQQLLQIEEMMGRIRTQKMGPRIIDLDILLYNQQIITTSLVTIPHPHMLSRRFVLEPLCEIAPTVIHPIENKSILSLLTVCTDNLEVHKISL